MAGIGDQLLQPEVGWNRYKAVQLTEMFFSTGWTQLTGTNGIDWNGTNIRMASTELNAKAYAKFYSSKIRILSTISSGHSDTIEVDIDGIKENMSLKGTTIKGALVYEKELELGEHIITLTNKNSGYIIIDCIDLFGEDSHLIKGSVPIGFPLLKPEEGWKRINDTDPFIKYTSDWKYSANTGCYSDDAHYSADINAEVDFKFYGSKIRIIGRTLPGRATNNYIIIDETKYLYTEQLPDGKQILTFHKEGLDKKVHTVKIGNETKDKVDISLDAMDIDSDGYMLASIGCQLLQPEISWNRFDDLEPLILFEGTGWKSESSTTSYDKTLKVTSTIDDYFQFDCIGKGFRLICKTDNTYLNNENIEIFIDEVSVDKIKLYSYSVRDCTLVYEYTFNTETKCTVKVKNTTGKMNIDCLDIKEGVILPTLSRDYEFPVAIIEEEELDAYCKSLINKEEQLLITPKGKMFLTDGLGSYTDCNKTESLNVAYTNNGCLTVADALDKIFSLLESINQKQ